MAAASSTVATAATAYDIPQVSKLLPKSSYGLVH
jgi:hypothetical protein